MSQQLQWNTPRPTPREPSAQSRESRRAELSDATTVITQAMLTEFAELSELTRRREGLRTQILGMMEAGTPIEPGLLMATILRREARRLTVSGLKALIGEEDFKLFMSEMPPVAYRTLVVRETGWGTTRR